MEVDDRAESGLVFDMRVAQRSSGLSRLMILRKYFKHRLKGNRLLLSEYLALGLYQSHKAGDFIGVRGATELALAVNFKSHRRALVQDKLLFDGMLRGLGFPVPDLQAVYGKRPVRGIPNLHNAAAFADFLTGRARYPLFCKPLRGQGSEGVFAIESYDPNAAELVLFDGARLDVGAFVAGLGPVWRQGYLVQSRLVQHADVTALVGETIGTVRIITFLEKTTAIVIAGFWKVPVGKVVADNLWRGNAIAAVDLKTGAIGRVLESLEVGAKTLQRHPDTGAELTGMMLPDWDQVIRLCGQAAELLTGLPILGWDVALTVDGPVIIEANSVPSLDLAQYPDAEGLLTPALRQRFRAEVTRLLGEKCKNEKAWRKRRRALVLKRLARALGRE